MNPRIILAILSLLAGMILLFQGISPVPSNFFDLGLIFLGLSLITGYVAILGDIFERWIDKSPSKAIKPVISSLGAAVLWQSTRTIYTLPNRVIMACLGFVFLILPFIFWLEK
jgi:4-hydroxybenzoate polyprenyltransferase